MNMQGVLPCYFYRHFKEKRWKVVSLYDRFLMDVICYFYPAALIILFFGYVFFKVWRAFKEDEFCGYVIRDLNRKKEDI